MVFTNKIKYLRVYFELRPNNTVVMLNTEKYRPQVVEYPLSSAIYGNKPIESPRYRVSHKSLRGVIRPVLEYEEVTNLNNIEIEIRGENAKVILHEDTKTRILETVGKWAEKNWQEMPTHI